MTFRFDHNNINVADIDKSLRFYQEALGLREKSRTERDAFTLVFLTDGVTDWKLELTCLKNHTQPYDLGENEIHLCLTVDDFESAHKKHGEMGCICYENTEMGLYFISDPDGYWIEIVPARR